MYDVDRRIPATSRCRPQLGEVFRESQIDISPMFRMSFASRYGSSPSQVACKAVWRKIFGKGNWEFHDLPSKWFLLSEDLPHVSWGYSYTIDEFSGAAQGMAKHKCEDVTSPPKTRSTVERSCETAEPQQDSSTVERSCHRFSALHSLPTRLPRLGTKGSADILLACDLQLHAGKEATIHLENYTMDPEKGHVDTFKARFVDVS